MKLATYTAITIILLAIMLLQCRTAYIIALLFFGGAYGEQIIAFAKQKLGVNKKTFIALLSIFSIAFIMVVAFKFKGASSNGRLLVWKNCIGLIAEKPLLGHGFGMFQKEYNLFVAGHGLPSNGHVNMAYNDFLELGVEGGLVAVLIWCTFLFAAIRAAIKRNSRLLLPLIAFVFVQLVNFGFQAIPVFALFLVYVGLSIVPIIGKSPKEQTQPSKVGTGDYIYWILLLAPLLLLHQISLANAFYKSNEIAKNYLPSDAIAAFGKLDNQLGHQATFHEAFGDAYFKTTDYGPAIQQYVLAAQTSSTPEIFSKTGYCYELQKNYDSSIYYYNMVQAMEPYRYAPRMALLKLYQQKGDTTLALQKAKEIMALPIKVESEKVDRMRAYAQNLIK
jgi:hypothetical protein